MAPGAEVLDKVAGRPQVKPNALLLGKVFASPLSDCTKAPSDTGDLVKNASQYSGTYKLKAGYRRCAARLGAPGYITSWCEFDAPQYIASPEWLLYEAIASLRLPKGQ